LDLKDIREILELIEEKDVVEFELEEGGRKLRIRKGATSSSPAPSTTVPSSAGYVASPAPPSPAVPSAALAAGAEEADSSLTVVKSPIVGTFYRAADPNSPPFVQVGDRVRVGQVLCIIEAMKLMNEIESEVAGEIVRIHHENGQPVEYGEPLFSVRT
jgi:acetyl-CoA carboxylase biotin carboxyl carrier protein